MGDETLCRCGHDKATHEYEYSPVKGECSHGGTNGVPACRCRRFAPAPDVVSVAAQAPLTDDEREALHKWSIGCKMGEGCDQPDDCWGSAQTVAVESLLADRVAPLLARIEELEDDLLDMTKTASEYNDLAHSANADWSKELERADTLREELDNLRDRVTALADEGDRSDRHINGYGYVLLRDLRAAIVGGSDDEATADHPTCTHGVHLRTRCEDCEGWTDMGGSDDE